MGFCHSRESGNPFGLYLFRRPREGGDPVSLCERHWIPAFAGMTSLNVVAFNATHAEPARRCRRQETLNLRLCLPG